MKQSVVIPFLFYFIGFACSKNQVPENPVTHLRASDVNYSCNGTEKCALPGAKCAGDALTEGDFGVFPCCAFEDFECKFSDRYGIGKFCLPKATYERSIHVCPTGPTCYVNFDRCAGAVNQKYHVWKPCCDKNARCVEDEALGWGRFCKRDPLLHAKSRRPCYGTESEDLYSSTQSLPNTPTGLETTMGTTTITVAETPAVEESGRKPVYNQPGEESVGKRESTKVVTINL